MSYGTKKIKTENELREAGYASPPTPEGIWEKIKKEQREADNFFLFCICSTAFVIFVPAATIIYCIIKYK